MSLSRSYYADSGPVSISGTSATPAMWISTQTVTTADLNIVGIKGSVSSAGGAPPANTSILMQLAVVSGTKAGGATVTPRATGQSALAAQSVWSSGSTPLTGLTEGNVIWAADLSYAAGSIWGEWLPQGFERNIPANSQYAFYFTAGVAGSGCSIAFRVDFGE